MEIWWAFERSSPGPTLGHLGSLGLEILVMVEHFTPDWGIKVDSQSSRLGTSLPIFVCLPGFPVLQQALC